MDITVKHCCYVGKVQLVDNKYGEIIVYMRTFIIKCLYLVLIICKVCYIVCNNFVATVITNFGNYLFICTGSFASVIF